MRAELVGAVPGPDAAIAAEALELLEWPRLAAQLASFASTGAGERHCRALPWPASCAASRELLAETTELLGLDGVLEGGLSFRGVADIGPTVARCAKGGGAGGEELLALAATLAAARRLRRQIDDTTLRPVCSALVAELRTLPELEQRLHFCLEEGGRVADRASAELEALRRQLQGTRAERRERLQELIRRWGALLQDTVVAERGGRPVLAVKAGAAGQISGLVHDSSASGSTVFVEPQAVIPLGNRIRELERREREIEAAILLELSGLVGAEVEALEHLRAVLVRLDAGLARARYAAWLGAVRPELAEDPQSAFELRALRHPLLLWQERREGGRPVVPVDVAVAPELRVVAITGPNTGGKTVTLKSVGLAVLMARAGLFLPCAGTPRLPWCARVLADIGDEQSLQQNLSTFSGHIRRIARILAALSASSRSMIAPAAPPMAVGVAPDGTFAGLSPASDASQPHAADPDEAEVSGSLAVLPASLSGTAGVASPAAAPNGGLTPASAAVQPGGASLVLLDEVGAGTDPTEGAALAAALLRQLADRARLTIATTHFGELKALKYGDSRFENASVAFDEQTLSPTYRLQWGIPGRSNALAIATRLGLDAQVVQAAAEQLRPGGSGEVNQVIEGLERQRQQQQEAAEAAAALLARTELLHEELLSRWQQQKEQSAEIQEQRRRELEHSIREGQGEVRRLIRRLRQGGRSGGREAAETARVTGQRLKRLQQEHSPQPQRIDHGGWRPAVGDRVRLLALGKAAQVLAISEDGRELTVRCGVLRTTVDLGAIEGLNGEKAMPPPQPQVQVRSRRNPASRGPDVRTEANTVDVRGLRVHEAEAAVEERLRGANGPIWVIHGIGTGKLKRGLRDWLTTIPYVERVSDADKGDGGPGCSVVWVK
ncbi:MAG: endonuclease MutS2 [Synechococcaceae cyanobacterium]|nr:endonuclease MutS2 [Synechococcaceae cyanobacterium]